MGADTEGDRSSSRLRRDRSRSLEKVSIEDPNLKYELLDELGKGSYGSVYKGRDRVSSELCAIKIMSLAEGEDGYDDIRGEIEMLQQCNHPNVVRYMGSYKGEDYLWIVMEYCGGGSVADLINATDEPLEEPMIAYICKEALKGLLYLHSIFKVHRDIKGGNLLLTDSGEVKLGDFGVSAQLTRTMSKRNTVDVWALGVTAIEMAEVLFMISRESPPTLADPEKWSLLFHDFVAKCLTKEPKNRPTTTTLLQHKFVDKCKGSALILKKRIDGAKSLKEEEKKRALASKKEQDSAAAQAEDTWEGGGTVKVKGEDEDIGGTILISRTRKAVEGAEGDESSATSALTQTADVARSQNNNEDFGTLLVKAEESFSSPGMKPVGGGATVAITSASNMEAAKAALGGGGREGRKESKKGSGKKKEPASASTPNKWLEDSPGGMPSGALRLSAASPRMSADGPKRKGPDEEGVVNKQKGVAFYDKLLAVYAGGSTVPLPFLRATQISPLAMVTSFGEDGVTPDQAALDAIQDFSGGLPLPLSVYRRLGLSTTISNLARALAYHKQCLEEMPLVGSEVVQQQATIQNLSDTLRTILRL